MWAHRVNESDIAVVVVDTDVLKDRVTELEDLLYEQINRHRQVILDMRIPRHISGPGVEVLRDTHQWAALRQVRIYMLVKPDGPITRATRHVALNMVALNMTVSDLVNVLQSR